MKAILVSVLVVLCSAAIVARATDVNGRWRGTVHGPQGDFDLTYTFHVEGETLGGTVEGPGGTLDITNGTIKGDRLAFNVILDSANTITNEGVVKDQTIALTSHGPWGDTAFTLNRIENR